MRSVTRREFIVDGSMLVGGAIATVGLGGTLLSPRNAQAAKVDFPESNCGPKKEAAKKVLVAYASHCGTTAGVAQAIGEVLCDSGANVDVRLVKNAGDLSSYQAIVVGSATRSASWWPGAISFVEANRQSLSRVPVAYFLTCLALYKNTEEARKVAKSYMEPVLQAAPEVKPIDMGFFAGALDYSKLSFAYRTIMKIKGAPEGDHRDWNAIRAWAKGLCSPLLGA
jgi:menaquinone-dependent protoporphyrinogen oxidase